MVFKCAESLLDVFVVKFKVSGGIVPFSPFGKVHWTVRKPQLNAQGGDLHGQSTLTSK